MTYLVVPFERPPELTYEPRQQQLSDLRQLRVENSDECGKDGREGQTRGLCLHDTPSEQPSTPDEIFLEKFGHDVFDISDIDTIDDTSDGFAKGVPRKPLVLCASLVLGGGLLKSAQSRRGHINTTRSSTREFRELCFSIELLFLLLALVLCAGRVFFLLEFLELHGGETCSELAFSFCAPYGVCVDDFWDVYEAGVWNGSGGRRPSARMRRSIPVIW